MNPKTLPLVEAHGKTLLQLFPRATIRDPVALCRRLRRLEVSARQLAEYWCNIGTPENADQEETRIMSAVAAVLGAGGPPIEFNRDARGYALKIPSEWMADHWEDARTLPRDMGGYGLIAPDLSPEA